MEKRSIRDISKNQATSYAKAVLENEMNCSVQSIKFVGGGSYGYAFKAEIDKEPHNVIIKGCRVEGMHKTEARDLSLLREGCPVPMPQVYFTFDSTDSIPMDFLCMEFMQGKDCFTNFALLFKSKKRKQAFADNVTTAMHYWHNRTNDKFGLTGNAVYDSWLDYYKPFAEDILKTAREMTAQNKLDRRTLSAMEKAWANFDYIFSEKVEKPSLIHGDLNVMNIMSDNNLQNISIIDPLESKWGDPEFDLFQLRNLTGDKFNLYQTYKNKYKTSEKCDIKCAFYALYNEIYCYISSGTKIDFILKPLVKRMNKELKKHNLV